MYVEMFVISSFNNIFVSNRNEIFTYLSIDDVASLSIF